MTRSDYSTRDYPTSDADILIVDDNPANVELLLNLLEDEGYTQIEGITNPLLVESRLEQSIPDLILLDVRMPGITGLDLMERLQTRFAEHMPAIIVLTAQTDEHTRYQALNLGARDFLTKPFDHVEVLKRIQNTLQVQQQMNKHTERADVLQNLVADRTAALERLSRQDPVTGLPNRRAILEYLGTRQVYAHTTSVLFLVLEGSDEIARLHGYGIADQVSQVVCRELQHLPQHAPAFMGVWNSSEWVLVYHNMSDQAETRSVARLVLDRFNQAFYVEGMALNLRARVGISKGSDAPVPEQWIRCAALALPATDNQWQHYTLEQEKALIRRTQLRDALRKAIDSNELHLLYQPKVSLLTGDVLGAEALLRWESPEYGRISPAEFVPLAEGSGDIIRIGEWVVHESLRVLKQWRSHGTVPDYFTLAVNVASVQLMQPEFAQRLINRVQAAGLPPHVVEIEVTESGLMQDMDLAMRQLEAVSQAGIRVAIDDFGTGYSSLAYLKRLPVSVLKIDREFIRELHKNPQDQRLTSTVIDMARHFRFMTVAEGIEQIEQLDLLIAMGCDVGQGYMFAPPLKEQALLTLVQSGFGHLDAFCTQPEKIEETH